MHNRFYFHANASKTEGSGHVMRMYALAEEAKSRNIETVLVGKVSEIYWMDREFLYQAFDNVLENINYIPIESKESLLVWDSYLMDKGTLEILKLPFLRRYLIADAATPIQYADGVFLLEDSPAWKTYLTETRIPFVEGRNLAPIRKSHQVGSNFSATTNSDSLKILIFSGGVDFRSFVQPLSHYILSNFLNFSIIAISNSELPIESERLIQLKYTREFDVILDQVDLVITSASTSIIEVLSRRIPSGFVVTASNQEANRDFLLKENLSIEVGLYDQEEFRIDVGGLEKLLTNFKARQHLQENSLRLVDGLGSSRIIENILQGFRYK